MRYAPGLNGVDQPSVNGCFSSCQLQASNASYEPLMPLAVLVWKANCLARDNTVNTVQI